ncbi:MAG TPA: HAD-IC family P-type ATPase, partial [Chroococcidiopsis sp.]
LGAVRMLGQDVLIQQANAVESLSNVNVLCLDKTGTLTTNQLQLQAVHPLAGMSGVAGIAGMEADEDTVRSQLGMYAASVTAGNRTIEAIAAECPSDPYPTLAEVPFSSARKWSAIAIAPSPVALSPIALPAGVYLLGAPEVLAPAASLTADTLEQIQRSTEAGLRVVLFAFTPDQSALGDVERPQLPDALIPLAVLVFGDQLRPEAKATLDGFMQAGIAVKIISGDNPQTVAALAHQAGLGETVSVISGQDLSELDDAQFAQAAQTYKVFGRITPDQKARLVASLRKAGNYVAMIGDGVNDILSLKQASLAIAMESGSKATRGVADIVLLKDSFGALPHAFLEGQRIRNGIQDVLKLFMVRTLCVTLLIFATAIVTDSFPLENKQSAVVTLLGVGFPSMFVPIWAKPGFLPQRSLVRSMLHFIVPATLTLTLVALLVYLFYLVVAILDLPPGSTISRVNYDIPRSALVTILVLGELFLIPFLKPPTTAWVGGEPLSGDWRYSWVALILLGVYIMILVVPPMRNFFELFRLGTEHYLFIGLVAVEWCLILRMMWRTRFLDRFLGVDLS